MTPQNSLLPAFGVNGDRSRKSIRQSYSFITRIPPASSTAESPQFLLFFNESIKLKSLPMDYRLYQPSLDTA